jgi:hypothetical protein
VRPPTARGPTPDDPKQAQQSAQYMYRHWSIFNALKHTRLRGIAGNFIQRKSGFFPYSELKKNYSFSNKDAEII